MSINLSALMKQRYDTAANWTAQNPTLLAGEIGIESDTKKWKVGTGATAWTSLVYAIGGTYPIVNADIAAAAAIVDTKLATIATAGKVSNSATTAASANTASAIVARDASGNFTAGTITAALTGAASSNVLKAGDTMTGVLAVTAGTAALPGIAVSGDPNTGIYSPGADQLAVATNGTERLRITSAGLVGIGSSSPASKLTVAGTQGNFRVDPDSVSNEVQLFATVPDNSGFINYRIRAYQLFVDTNGVTALTIDSSQRVGINTTSPISRLNTLGTQGNWRIDPDSVSGEIQAFTTSTDNSGFIAYRIRTNQTIFDTAGFERARIDSSGRLLVGTSSDSGGALLQVNGDRIRVGTAKTPATASDTGTAGEICWDASYIYVCTATNTWKRTAIATW